LRHDLFIPNPLQFSTCPTVVWHTDQRLKMSHQQTKSFPWSKPNYFHKRGVYDRVMAVNPRATGGVIHNYNQFIWSHFMCRFWVRFEKQFRKTLNPLQSNFF
jgi:hypothetical protein